MKKQINPTIKAHLIRGAFYLILLVAVCAIPFALAARNTGRREGVAEVINRDSLIFPLLRRRVPFELRRRNCQTLKEKME